MMISLLTVEIRYEQDVVLARQRSRQIAGRLGFDARGQAWVATAVSEIARNAFQYGGGGRVEFRLEEALPQQFVIAVRDQGPGIASLREILDGHYISPTGMGLGIIGARRLMDTFEIQSVAGQGTTVVMGKFLPRRAPLLTAKEVGDLAGEWTERFAPGATPKHPQNPYEEIQQQNQELLRTLEELRKREDQLSQLNRELEDTNRGVVALYAELDEKAECLQRANEIKTRFLSNMSHEFRTPVNSILSLTGLLLDQVDGTMNLEQEKQVSFIRKAADALSDLVNDLLDLAKVEAGKVEVRPGWFQVSELFGALRGMLRPLLVGNPAVSLVFVEPEDMPLLYSDDGKVAQILRNFISNSLKFTERGEVRVSAMLLDGCEEPDSHQWVAFRVEDTGIGIAAHNQERIFEDFVQLDSHRQRQVKGTGLGLPLSRRLAELLGGTISVCSELGQGSVFVAILPRIYGFEKTLPPSHLLILKTLDSEQLLCAATSSSNPASEFDPPQSWSDRAAEPAFTSPAVQENQESTLTLKTSYPRLLLIDDDPMTHYLVQQALLPYRINLLTAEDGQVGLTLARTVRPQAIVLDLAMPEIRGDEVLTGLEQYPETQSIPVIVQTSRQLEPAEIEQLRKRAIAVLPKGDDNFGALFDALVRAGFDLVGG